MYLFPVTFDSSLILWTCSLNLLTFISSIYNRFLVLRSLNGAVYDRL